MADQSHWKNLSTKKQALEQEKTLPRSPSNTRPRLRPQVEFHRTPSDWQRGAQASTCTKPIEAKLKAAAADMQELDCDFKRNINSLNADESVRAHRDMYRRAEIVNERERAESFGETAGPERSRQGSLAISFGITD